MLTLTFIVRLGPDQPPYTKYVPPAAKFSLVVHDVLKKLQLHNIDAVMASATTQETIPESFMDKSTQEVVSKYGSSFLILNRGEVGASRQEEEKEANHASPTLSSFGGIEQIMGEFPPSLARVTPNHPAWLDRVKLELAFIKKYRDLLAQRRAPIWFQLIPSRDPRENYQQWFGWVRSFSRPEVKLDVVVLLTSEYPQTCPRAFLHFPGDMYQHVDKIWPKLRHHHDGRDYIMICHDHLHIIEGAWRPTMGIAHFIMRQVWIWWASQERIILRAWNLVHGAKEDS